MGPRWGSSGSIAPVRSLGTGNPLLEARRRQVRRKLGWPFQPHFRNFCERNSEFTTKTATTQRVIRISRPRGNSEGFSLRIAASVTPVRPLLCAVQRTRTGVDHTPPRRSAIAPPTARGRVARRNWGPRMSMEKGTTELHDSARGGRCEGPPAFAAPATGPDRRAGA